MSPVRNLIVAAQLLRVLQKECTPAEIMTELAPLVLGDGDLVPPLRIAEGPKWQAVDLVRAIYFVREIVSRYVQLYQDPRDLPVIFSQRQKNVAIKLDQQFRILLRETVIRSGRSLHENGTEVRDDFLDESILHLKQEARSKQFPKTKNRGVKLSDLQTRFDDKMLVKGAKLQQLEAQDRFIY